MTFEAYCIRRQRENAALHEAGHTVIGVKVGNGVDRVELWPGVQEDGRIPEGITTFKNFRSLSRETGIKLLLAGPLAEKHAGVIGFDKCTDFDRVAMLLRGSGLDFKALIAETESLIVRFWAEIQLLQSQLMHRRVLVGDEITEAMTPWSAGK